MTTSAAPTRAQPASSGRALQRAGGLAALYAVCAYLVAIPYFVLIVDYPSVVDPVDKVALLRDHKTSMYLMHVVSFEFSALALIVVTLAVEARLRCLVPTLARVGMVIGIVRSGLLLASVMIFDYGMTSVVHLWATAPDQAVAAWQSLEPMADALGGSGGEIMGGLWVAMVSVAALRAGQLPSALNWLGLVAGGAGILSIIPGLSTLEVVFSLLQIPWLLWLGTLLLRNRSEGQASSPVSAG